MTLGIKLVTPSRRDVFLSQLHLLPSRNYPKRMVDEVPGLIERYFSSEIPYLIKNPHDGTSPITCMALFTSAPMIARDVTIQESLLIVCWFVKSADMPLRNIACEGLAEIDWERHAKDFHSEW